MSKLRDVIIVGGGLAGLSTARQLVELGHDCLVLEASDQPGGRVRTDEVDGFLLDRGFQVFLTAYPEAQAVLDYDALDLKLFCPGALVRHGGKFHRLADPWRQPQHLIATALSPVASLADKLRIARFRSDMQASELGAIYTRAPQPTIDMLRSRGFSRKVIDRFFKPFLGGIFLEPQLNTSSRMGEFVFQMFSQGDATLPATGMHAIPRQLAGHLPEGVLRTNAPVQTIQRQDDQWRVLLDTGEELTSRAVVLATPAPAVRELAEEFAPDAMPAADACSVCNLYFAAEEPPIDEPTLVLNGDGPDAGPINNLAVPSLVAPQYAPVGQSLVSVAVLGKTDDEPGLVKAVRDQLADWFGASTYAWQHLRTYQIPYALPSQSPPQLDPLVKPARLADGLYVAGDHRDTGSINGAFAAARRAAEAVQLDFSDSAPVVPAASP